MSLSAKDQVIARLLGAGFSPTTLSAVLEMDLDEIVSLGLSRSVVLPEEEAIEAAARMVAYRAMEEAMRLLDEGNVDVKVRLISKVMSPLAAMFQSHDDGGLEEIRADMATLMKEIRGPGHADAAVEDPDQEPPAGAPGT